MCMKETIHFLREWREFRKLSQWEAAGRLDELVRTPAYATNERAQRAGRSYSVLGKMERGASPASDIQIELLAKIYGTTPTGLLSPPPSNDGKRDDNISDTNNNSRFEIPVKGVGSLHRENALNPQGVRMIPIVGTVQAGAWTTVDDFEYPDENTEFVPFDEPKYKRATVLALTVQGNSCNLRYPHGSKVFVVPAAEKGVHERDFVIVRDYDVTGKAETTIKQVVQKDGVIELWPRSTDPKCQEPVTMKSRDDQAQDGPHIWAVVVGAYQAADEGGDLIDLRSVGR